MSSWRNPALLTPKCPSCGTAVGAATGVSGSQVPEPGNISICAYCTGVAMYDDELALRELEDEELAALQQDPVWEIIKNVKAALEKHPVPR